MGNSRKVCRGGGRAPASLGKCHILLPALPVCVLVWVEVGGEGRQKLCGKVHML